MGNKTTNYIGAILIIIFGAFMLSGLIQAMHKKGGNLSGKLMLTISPPEIEDSRFARIKIWPENVPINRILGSLFGATERPLADFDHVLHMKDIGEKGCRECHTADNDGYLNLKVYVPAKGDTVETMADKYHENCIGCHEKRDEGPKKECGECHVEDGNERYVNLTFYSKELDLREHQLHVAAMNNNCGVCHHKYDEATKKLVSVEAEEATSCRDCHRMEDTDTGISLRTAAHMKCVSCHLNLSGSGKKAGPVDCTGCHSELDTRPAVIDMGDVPRLLAGQNDMPFILVENNSLKGVPFNHIGHEKIAKNCRTCHHESLNPCRECHTLKGGSKSDNVTLAQAYHNADSDHSCVGCHEQRKSRGQCSACHEAMPQGPTESSCVTCHSGKAGTKLDKYPFASAKALIPDDLPETISIDTIQKTMKPVEFPHMVVIHKMNEVLGKDKLADTFHADRRLLCAGCHHNSPVGKRPPPCSSCHGAQENRGDINMPNLMGALHRNCLECHKKMKVTNYISCNSCHSDYATVSSDTGSR